MMLGYLLARKGVQVTVLEKHADFFRDFRGDTVHPSTLEVFWELGLVDDLLKLPHQRITKGGGVFGDFEFTAVDFRHLPVHCRFVALMPQWDFLDFLAGKARQFPSFRLQMQHEATDLLWENGRVAGVSVKSAAGVESIHADLVIACDGRHSTMRRCAGLDVVDTGVPIDVLWFRIRREPQDTAQLLGRVNYGKALVLINRGDYFQAGLIIRKGSFEQIQDEGLPNFRNSLLQIAPFLGERVTEVKDWEQVKLLSVQINHLRRWHRPGLLCIGDAAHAMSPAGGVGINLAIQDAIAAARILGDALRRHHSTDQLLGTVQRRREWPTRVIQTLQKQAHLGFARMSARPQPFKVPFQFRVVVHIPGVQRIMGRLIGLGPRPEHVTRRRPNRSLIAIACGVGAALAILTGRRLIRIGRTARLASTQ
jgi:2-polyprenyl-6-methoxyphenol hydroxylase-like FAD-dependent oxidoreductase